MDRVYQLECMRESEGEELETVSEVRPCTVFYAVVLHLSQKVVWKV